MSIKRGNTVIAGVPIIEGALNTVSVLPVQNKVITKAINDLNDRIDTIMGGGIYTKQETDALLSDKADKSTTYTKAEVDSLFATLYPVGSIYIGTQNTCPLITLIPGSVWELVSQDKSLQGSSNQHAADTTITAGLPNITATFGSSVRISAYNTTTPSMYGTGAVTVSNRGTSNNEYSHVAQSQGANYAAYGYSFNANSSSSIYGSSTTVQPPAYIVNVWRRTA